MDKIFVENIIQEHIRDTDMFLVELKAEGVDSVTVYVDRMSGLTVKDCMNLNRVLENAFETAGIDASITVSSAGLDKPLRVVKQYIKNIGRTLELELADGRAFTAKMTSANESGIALEWEEKVKVNGKNKKEQKSEFIEYTNIKKANIVISFK